MPANDPDGFRRPKNPTPRRRLIQTHEDLDALRRTILAAMVIRGWEVENVASDGGRGHRHVRFARGKIQLDFNLWVGWSSSVRAAFYGDRETDHRSFQSELWEIYGDNPQSWEDAIAEAVQQLIERVQDAQNGLGRVIAALRSLPGVQSKDKDWSGLVGDRDAKQVPGSALRSDQ